MPEPAAGTRLNGRYVLDGRIGLGGMSEVWRAADETLGRQVAVKILSGTASEDPLLRAAIRREARAAARMTHPHAMRVYDFGEVDTGDAVLPYIVMELVEGATLADVPPLTWRAAARMAAEISAALADAHRLGVVHRDIKPANVMLTPSGAAKVLDFGIATLVNADAAPLAGSFTGGRTGGTEILDGWLAGTPPYAAPELLIKGEVGPPADVYAVGATLYQALTGAPPLAIGSWEEAAEIHRSGTAVPAPLPPSVPEALATACLACLARDPAARPTAAAIARIFGGYAAGAGEPVAVFTPTTVMPVSGGPSDSPGGSSGGAGQPVSPAGSDAWAGSGPGGRGGSGPGEPGQGGRGGSGSHGSGPGGSGRGRSGPGSGPGGSGSGGSGPGSGHSGAGSGGPGDRSRGPGRFAPGAASVPSAAPDFSVSPGFASAPGGYSSAPGSPAGPSGASGFSLRGLVPAGAQSWTDRHAWEDRLRGRAGIGVLAGGLIVGGVGLVALAALLFGPDQDRKPVNSAGGSTTPATSAAATPTRSATPSRTPGRPSPSTDEESPGDAAEVGVVLNRLDAALAQGLLSRDINARAGTRLFDDLSELRSDADDPEKLADGADDLQERLADLADAGDITEAVADTMIEIAEDLKA
ncbi:serine/threonine-protein kinase [Catenuloplanes japonicus]|uniref:serine/threonine-protein kinase n=1 Tax=Catenuloplanes japonicus TaxID=33876 RepID=UPI00068FEC10|nr:serine/threonine-protein kinase [Catenuloplanes japonicus]